MMTSEKAIQKELQFLLDKHNRATPYKIKQIDLDVPPDILKILCQAKRRTSGQNIQLKHFRKEVLLKMAEISQAIKEQRLQKSRITKEMHLLQDDRYTKHFGMWINNTLSTAQISRKSYAIIDPTPSHPIDELTSSRCIFDENNTPQYSIEYCTKFQQLCLENFDINMSKYAALNHDEFESFLSSYVKRRHFQEIFDLDDEITSSNIKNNADYHHEGYVYIMVLDTYKQVYIGITRASVKQRIKQHWNKKMPFDRLINGDPKTSVLSINSFGPLDTTRIFALRYYCKNWIQLENYESRCIKAFDDRYILNRLR